MVQFNAIQQAEQNNPDVLKLYLPNFKLIIGEAIE